MAPPVMDPFRVHRHRAEAGTDGFRHCALGTPHHRCCLPACMPRRYVHWKCSLAVLPYDLLTAALGLVRVRNSFRYRVIAPSSIAAGLTFIASARATSTETDDWTFASSMRATVVRSISAATASASWLICNASRRARNSSPRARRRAVFTGGRMRRLCVARPCSSVETMPQYDVETMLQDALPIRCSFTDAFF